VLSGAGKMDSAAAELDEDEDKEAAEEHGVHGEEVHCQDRVGMGMHELPPGASTPPRRRLNPMPPEYLADGGVRAAVTQL
jgi:hypothetical protein